jgi:optic atrophy 3 protein
MSTVKLATLLIKTLSKPLASSLKRRAKSDARFHSFCISVANVSLVHLELQQNRYENENEFV